MNHFPPRAALKRQARQTMIHYMRPCMAASAAMLALKMAALFFQMNFGGVLSYYIFDAADYASTTGIWMAENGLTAILRLETAGALFALPLSFHQMISFVIVNVIIFIIITPLLMGVLEQYHAILQNKSRPFSEIFRWYLDLRLTAKAVGLGLVLSFVKWSTRIISTLPGFALLVWVAGNGQAGNIAVAAIPYLAISLILAGAVASYWVYTFVLPAQYLLACEPESSVLHVLSAGTKVFQGQRRHYFLFRLSFFLWYIGVNISYGTMGFFVLPYSELSNLIYLQAVLTPTPTEDIPAEL